MNGLIPIDYENEQPTVSGRDLHKFLEVATAYKDWFPRMCEYGFTEGMDFCSKLSESTGGRPSTDHRLSIQMGKEISMLQRTERGKLARQHFIRIEDAWNTPEAVMARALKLADQKIKGYQMLTVELEERIALDAPKVHFANSVAASTQSILIGELAKLLKQNGVDIGQNRLFERLRADGYLIKGGDQRNMPTQRAMEMGLFEIKERTIDNPDGSVRLTRTTKVTGRGQIYFINRYGAMSA